MPFNIKKLRQCGLDSIHKNIKERESVANHRPSEWSFSTQWTVLSVLLINQCFRIEIQKIFRKKIIIKSSGSGVDHHRGGAPIVIGGNEMSRINYLRFGECLPEGVGIQSLFG
jgi:hypothetical protein